MGRRLAEARKGRRPRRRGGEMALRFFLVPLETAVFFLEFLEGACLADAAGLAAVDWADAGGKKPSERGKKIPAKTKTAKRRTQTLPTAQSWHPCWRGRLLRDFLLFHVESNWRKRHPCCRDVSGTWHGFSRWLLSDDHRDCCFSGLRRPLPDYRV